MAETEKAAVTPEQKATRRAAKILAFYTWRQDWTAANPSATKDDLQAAWSAVSGPELRKARKAIKRLEKGGFKLVAAEA
jgi:hypothetical protein